MHWLEEQLASLRSQIDDFERLRKTHSLWALEEHQGDGQQLGALESSAALTTRARRGLSLRFAELSEAICRRPGLSTCVVSHEGLPLSFAGFSEPIEALSALSQDCQVLGRQAKRRSQMGQSQQMVIISGESKLALFFIGPFVLSILSPKEIQLAQVLS